MEIISRRAVDKDDVWQRLGEGECGNVLEVGQEDLRGGERVVLHRAVANRLTVFVAEC